MKVLSAVLGIALMALGFMCMFSPFASFLATGYFLCICMLVFGLFGIIRMCVARNIRPLRLIVDILAVVFGIIALVRPGASLIFDGIIIYLMAIWYLVYGVTTMIESVRNRKDIPGWGWGIVVGIFAIIVGVLALVYPGFAMFACGIMIGLFFVDAGLGMLTVGSLVAGFEGRVGRVMDDMAGAFRKAEEEASKAASEAKEDAADAASEVKDDVADAADDISRSDRMTLFREVARKKNALSKEECIKLLKEEKRGVLSVITDGEYPYCMPLNHYYDGRDGKIYFHSGRSGHKIDSIGKGCKACFCVHTEGTRKEDAWALDIKSVIVFGSVRVMDDPEKTEDISRRLSYKFTDDKKYIEDEIEKDLARTVLIEFTIEHMTGKAVNEA